jgi:hypothetical protein
MCVLLPLMISRDAETARCKAVWTCLVRNIVLQQDILLCSYKWVRRFFCSGFEIQNKKIRIISNTGIRVSYLGLFKKLQILTFNSQYIYSLLMFVVKNRNLSKLNSDIHGFGTRYDNDFHLPSTNLKLFQNGFFIQELKDIITFQRLSKNYHMMWNNSDCLWKDLLYKIPFIFWKSILTLTGSECCSIIQVTLLLVKWHVGC